MVPLAFRSTLSPHWSPVASSSSIPSNIASLSILLEQVDRATDSTYEQRTMATYFTLSSPRGCLVVSMPARRAFIQARERRRSDPLNDRIRAALFLLRHLPIYVVLLV
jgi:hypothetical protein